jgi:hypothetical protein
MTTAVKCKDCGKDVSNLGPTNFNHACVTTGTPDTLLKAVRNGVFTSPMSEMDNGIKRHVRDYLSQKFGVALLKSQNFQDPVLSATVETELKNLWKSITGEEI